MSAKEEIQSGRRREDALEAADGWRYVESLTRWSVTVSNTRHMSTLIVNAYISPSCKRAKMTWAIGSGSHWHTSRFDPAHPVCRRITPLSCSFVCENTRYTNVTVDI
jgi:hypothetical protein